MNKILCLLGSLMITLQLTASAPSDKDYKNPHLPIEERVKNLLKQMTLREKVAQMCQYVGLKHMQRSEKFMTIEELEHNHAFGFYKDLHSSQLARMVEEGLAGSFLHVTDLEEANYLQSLAMKSRLQIPLLIGIDAIHGNGLCSGVTIYPTAIGQASSFNPALVQKAAEETAREVRATGSHWAFTPNVDVARDPRWGRVGETFGEDPYLVARMGAATVRGLQGNNRDWNNHVLACVKHLVGGGQPENGRNCAPCDVSERTLREVFFPPFQACIEAGAETCMSAHNELNGIPCHSNGYLLQDMLRGEWGFTGFVVSDWMDIERLHTQHCTAESLEEASLQAVEAGIDMHMHGPGFMEHILKGVQEGRIPESRIDEAAGKILACKFKLGLFEQPYYNPQKSREILFCKQHQQTALELARQSIVLLTNHDILPLQPQKMRNILVVGPNADSHAILGDWGVEQPEGYMTSVLDGLKEVAPDTHFRHVDVGFRIFNIDSLQIQKAIEGTRGMDAAIVVVGENSMRDHWMDKTCGENTDRSDIALPGRQEELVEAIRRTGIPTIVVLVNGRPLGVEWIAHHADALLEAWEPGSLGGRAIAEIIYGKVNPSGKLPVTIPRHVGQLMSVYNQKSANTWFPYVKSDSSPLFHFGYGMSYTTYHYGQPHITRDAIAPSDSVAVNVEVTNTGTLPGDEIVQLYIRDDYSSATRPLKELKDFRRVHLAPGETRTVTFTITPDKLAFYDKDMHYGVERGTFTIMVGSSSRDEDLQSVSLTVR